MKLSTLLITTLALVSFASAQLTGEARLLKEKRDAKVAEIDKIYRAELEKIKLKELQNRNTAAVTAIQAELGEDVAAAPKADANTLESIIGKWKRVGSGTKYDGDLLEFTDTRSGNYNGSEAFKIRYNQTTKTITIDNGTWTNKINFTDKPDILNAVTDAGLTYQLVRVK